MTSKVKTLVIGLDGASFNFIQPWIDDGHLPNFKALIERGTSGELESCLPPVTMPAWRVHSTGKYPGKLGIFWHQQLDMKNRRTITPDATMVQSADYWDYLNKAGLRSGVVGMPDLFPPRPVDGFVVCGGPSASFSGFTYPPEIEEPLVSEAGYIVGLREDFHGKNEDDSIVQDAVDVVDKTFEGANYLFEKDPVDLLEIVSFDINRIQHFFYDGKPSFKAWLEADKWLGKLAPQFDYIFILSDHGTESLERAFFLNVWLKQEGYLATRFKPMDILPLLGINRTMLARIATFFGLHKLLDYESVRKYSKLLPSAAGVFGEFGNQAVLDRLNWSKTKAIALAQGPIYINRDLVKSDEEYEALRKELVEKLEAMTEPISGKKVFKKVFLREEVYIGPYADTSPDLVALNVDEYHNRAGLSQPNIFADSWVWKGNNRRMGLFIAAGPGIKEGEKFDGARIVDIAPTVLHVNQVDIPEDMDGRVLSGIFSTESAFGKDIQFQPPISFEPSKLKGAADDEVTERLKELGYL